MSQDTIQTLSRYNALLNKYKAERDEAKVNIDAYILYANHSNTEDIDMWLHKYALADKKVDVLERLYRDFMNIKING
jgi:hypothetical protein